jgi:hypothetical protein
MCVTYEKSEITGDLSQVLELGARHKSDMNVALHAQRGCYNKENRIFDRFNFLEVANMKQIRYSILLGGFIILVLALGFVFQMPFATNLWPWPDGGLSYLFIGSILSAVSAAAFWIGWTNELGALPAGALNVFVVAIASSIYLLQLAFGENRTDLFLFSFASMLMAIASGAAFLWSRRLDLHDSHPIPNLVRVSFGIFIAALFLTGGALVMKLPIFPWTLDPKSSVIFGCIFLGDAFYFLYGLLYPRWHNALGQLLSFLAYDLVLIFPFLLLFKTVKPEYQLNLIVYVAVLIYSGAIAVYYSSSISKPEFGIRTNCNICPVDLRGLYLSLEMGIDPTNVCSN